MGNSLFLIYSEARKAGLTSRTAIVVRCQGTLYFGVPFLANLDLWIRPSGNQALKGERFEMLDEAIKPMPGRVVALIVMFRVANKDGCSGLPGTPMRFDHLRLSRNAGLF